MTHLSHHDLQQWRDTPAEADRARIVAHLAACDECAGRYAELIRTRPMEDPLPARDMRDFVAAGLTQTPATAPPPVLGFGAVALRYAAGIAAVIALAVAVWQGVESRRLRAQLAQTDAERSGREQQLTAARNDERSRLEQVTRELQEERNARARLEQELAAQREATTPRSTATAPVVSLFLTAGRVRSAGETKAVRLPGGDAQLRLVLDLGEKRPYRSYDAEILDADGNRVWNRRGISAGQLVIVTVPATALAEDDYEIQLRGVTGTGASERVDDFAFTVLRK